MTTSTTTTTTSATTSATTIPPIVVPPSSQSLETKADSVLKQAVNNLLTIACQPTSKEEKNISGVVAANKALLDMYKSPELSQRLDNLYSTKSQAVNTKSIISNLLSKSK